MLIQATPDLCGAGVVRPIRQQGPRKTGYWRLTSKDACVPYSTSKRYSPFSPVRFDEVSVRSLLTDPKSRKVILVEHPLLPLYIKDALAKVLFGNLQVCSELSHIMVAYSKTSKVPSVSFASSHLLSLLSAGRITGLVIDCGHLESIALPVCCIFLTLSSD